MHVMTDRLELFAHVTMTVPDETEQLDVQQLSEQAGLDSQRLSYRYW